jgi:transcriptional regulator with XRE-family HTH domain
MPDAGRAKEAGMPDELAFGRWLKQRRRALDLTQEALGERVGCAVESMWRHLKNTVAANRLYGSLEVLRQTVFTFFRAMTAANALRWAGV